MNGGRLATSLWGCKLSIPPCVAQVTEPRLILTFARLTHSRCTSTFVHEKFQAFGVVVYGLELSTSVHNYGLGLGLEVGDQDFWLGVKSFSLEVQAEADVSPASPAFVSEKNWFEQRYRAGLCSSMRCLINRFIRKKCASANPRIQSPNDYPKPSS